MLGRTVVVNMVLAVQRGLEDQAFAMLWLVSYLYLLRLPSEAGLCCTVGLVCLCGCSIMQALPMCKMRPDNPVAAQEQTIIWMEDDTVCLRMLRRKNRQKGSGILKRKCSCRGGVNSCPVHMLWMKFFAELPEGAHPWAPVTPDVARKRLRQILVSLRVPNAQAYGTHDFRRGHADVSLAYISGTCVRAQLCPWFLWQDMREMGATLAEILAAGQWTSKAFLAYLDEACLPGMVLIGLIASVFAPCAGGA